MLGMEYFCPGIGNVRLMVGVRLRDKTKIEKDASRHPYDLPQECTADVYLLVGLGARTLHLTIYPIRTASEISWQR